MQAKPLVTLDEALLERCIDTMVVTANERLQYALIHAYDTYNAQRGLLSWPSARVSTLAAYLRDRYDMLARTSSGNSVLLSDDAQRIVWLDHAPPSNGVSIQDLYPPIADAWRLIHDWEIAPLLHQFGDNDNHRLFRDWTSNYIRAARSTRWLTAPELPALIAAAARNNELPGESLLLVGFDVVPPSLAGMVGAYRSRGFEVRFHTPKRTPASSIRSITCETPEQELRTAIDWARDLLTNTDEPIAVGIVVPDLVGQHDRVVGQLDAILRPNDSDPAPVNSPYNVSGGIALSGVPVIAAALDLLQWLHEPKHYMQVDHLLRSPFVSLGADPSKSFETLLPDSYDAALFCEFTTAAPLHELVNRSKRLGFMRFDAAVIEVKRLLEIAGWPNAGDLSSESFQAFRAFITLLDELSTAALLVSPRSFATTLAQIHRAAQRRLFAPQRPVASLHVLGYLETVGLEFTHLWVTGLDNLNWPAPPNPNPFIPLRLLRAARVARSDPDAEFVFANAQMQHWRSAAASVVFSHARVQNDRQCQASSLLGVLAMAEEQYSDSDLVRPSHPYLRRSPGGYLAPRTEPSIGPVILDRLRHRGSAVLRDQSACPFRAFARYRLHLVPRNPPHSFPDAIERGVATHAALKETFDRLGSNVDLAQLDETTLSRVIDTAAAIALAVQRRFPAPYRASEQARLRSLLREWLVIELARPPFRVVAIERETILSLAGIDFELRIDRVDALEPDGALLVIDYKTGATRPTVVIADRPEEPQLAMYALSLPNVAAIAFAQVRAGECRLTGWSEASRAITTPDRDVRLSPPPDEFTGDWNVLTHAWRDRLTRLANEFRSGVADVNPRDALACRQCNLHALCRIRETVRLVAQ